ncbi:MAG: tyrosine--tRNA ligase [Halobacteriota archaeon]|nr:tyrosine--tRNA ligase [Halobacteriota archaeon]
MDTESKIELVTRPPSREVVTNEDLRNLFETEEHPKHYIGYEVSGMIHLGSGYMAACKIKDLLKAGVKPTIFFADYHAWINGKLGGDLDVIKKVAKRYYQKAFESLGLQDVEYIFASDLYEDLDYWTQAIKIANNVTIKRVMRTLAIMGRQEANINKVAQLMYTPMQVADIFFMDVQLAHSGMDQRKAHMVAREVAPKIGEEKPVALHHGLLMGLTSPRRAGYDEDELLDLEISSKMSKSAPNTCIFIHDSPEIIMEKMKKAHCPLKEIENNPVLEHCKYITFNEQESIYIERPAKYGGDLEIQSYEELEAIYRRGDLHPLDLKIACAKSLIEVLTPSRTYFETHPELLDVFKEVEITK